MSIASWPGLTKGEGTGNDFVLLTDPRAELELTEDDVRAVCDRRFGIGADGLIRAVETDAAADALGVGALLASEAAAGRRAQWFMDYRNGDGSTAEMCGNGARVFVRYLLDRDLMRLEGGESELIATRAGVLRVWLDGSDIGVAMGAFGLPGGIEASVRGWDTEVRVGGLEPRPGLRVTMPNPHVVVAVASTEELSGADLTRPPAVEPGAAEGTNVELVQVLGESEIDGETAAVVRMRVHERGAGETLSCGTGACAVAVAARTWAGAGAPQLWLVQVPGGQVRVRVHDDGAVDLIGPARLVAEVTLR